MVVRRGHYRTVRTGEDEHMDLPDTGRSRGMGGLDWLNKIEIMEQQVEIFNSLSLKLEKQLLVSTLDEFDNATARANSLVEAWMHQIAKIMAGSGKTFIAVGAAHMPEEQGLITLLRAKGYKVKKL
jgi:uncharacterized protein YbaP (TraB family)